MLQKEMNALASVNQIYAELKQAKAGLRMEDLAYVAPELRPQIQSDQVKALIIYLVQKGVL